MTPDEKIKHRGEAQVRAMSMMLSKRQDDAERGKMIDSNYYAEGYAMTFEPYVLWEDEEGPIYERFERDCFVGCDMSDVIMQFDHAGRVFARTGNKSLVLKVDDHGLLIGADLGRTAGAKQLHEDIDAEMVQNMSWRFTIGDCEYDPATRTIIHHTVKKVWDVSAVSIPANDQTEINARAWGDGVIALAARSEAALEERRRKLRLKIKLQEDPEK